MKLRTETRGAALLIAVSILAILLALTVTFYTTSRIEMRLATNKRDSVSAQFVTEAGLALAQAHLRDDHAKRPTYTSLDHAWRTFFNGAWFAGKDWALIHREIDGDVVGDPSLPPIVYAEFVRQMQNPDDLYIPRVDENVYDQSADPPPTPEELLLQPWAIPDLFDTVNNPDGLTYAQWVDSWADVDVDDDGLKDAVWVPMPIDVVADDDGIDNDLDGVIDEPGELATFLYAHPTQDNVAVLSAPLYAVEVDEHGNLLGDPVDYTSQFVYNVPDWTVVLEGSDPDIPRRDNDFSQIIDDSHGYIFPADESVPLFDDDNVRREFTEHELQTHVPHQYNIVHNDYFPGTEGRVLTFSGEPECEVAGRVAVLVTDEASRVNLNTAHGRNFRDLPPQPPSSVVNDGLVDAFFDQQGAGLMGRALGEGLGPHEYDLRVLSDTGVVRSGRVDAVRSGAPGGRTFPAEPGAETGGDYFYPDDDRLAAAEAVPYVYDANLPGYGRVDDDGDAFWMAYDGIDNDGDGLIDEGFALPKAGDVDGDGIVDFDDGVLVLTDPYTGAWSQVSFTEFAGDGYDDRYQYLLGQFEGIDAPQEQRQFRPHRNLVAESDGVNNDAPFGDTKTDELGELGDEHYYTREQLKLVTGIGGTTFSRNRNVLTVHSADRNYRYNLEGDAPALSGLKLNYNLATPSQIATATINDLGYRPQFASDPALTAAERFAQGLRLEGVRFESDATAPLLGPSGPTSFEIDPVLRVQQTAVNIVDNRDPDAARTTLTSSTGDDWAADVGLGASRRINYTSAGIESIRINEIMARPVRRIEAEMYNTLAPPDSLLFRWAYVPSGVTLEDRLAEQFNPNYFTPQEFELDYGKRDFDMTQATLPRDRIVAAGNGPSNLHTLDNYTVPIDPARSLWDGRPVWVNDGDIDPFPPGSTYGVPAAPSIAVAGRRYMPGEDASDPTAYHLGAGSYVSFSSRFVDADNVVNDVSATTVAIAAPPPTPLAFGEEWHETPNMIQFRFGPGPGLPPGRYYLLANVTRNGNAATTTMLQGQENKLNYVMKYGQAGDDILSDAVGFVTASEINYLDFLGGGAFQDVPGLGYVYDPITAAFDAVHKGDAGDGPIIGTRPDVDGVQRETGMVFLPSLPEPDPTLVGALAPYGNREEFYAYTVVIPEYAADPADQEYLYLGVWKNNDPQYTTGDPLNDDLVVNYFEFSQEPDHEWVEVVNVAAVDPVRPIEDQYIDMSDWRLQVGRTATQRHHRLFTVPEGTRIAPGGSLILAVTKFDVGADKFNQNTGDFSALSVLRRNGLGLAATDDDDLFPMFGVAGTRATQITVPPFPPVRPFRADDDPLLMNRPLGDSIFFRTPLALPLHDAETGLPSLNEWVDFIDADGDGLIGNSGVPLVVNVGGVDYAINDDFLFDTVIEQIVEPFPVEWRIQSSANDWPSNYPGPGPAPTFGSEARKPWDRIVQLSEVSLDRLGTNPSARLAQLARVVLDGGVFPNTPEEDWEDNDLDNATLSNDGVDNSGTSYLSYDQFTGAFAFLGDAGNPDFDNLGIDETYEGVDEGRYLLEARRAGVPVAAPGAYHPDPVNHAFRTELDDIEVLSGDYLGGAADPPEWKRFIERRFFPGDAVYVTLYDGPQSEARVVDRITYTQLDIENAALDDGVICLYENEIGPAALNPANLRMWPENTMGVDFYRSLERKHPLYHGDLAGVTNRWEATDGAYDDWDGGQGSFYFGDGVWYQPDAVDPDAVRVALTHGLSGTPGRMNFLHRTVETGDITATRIENDVLAWQHPRANVRNRPFTTPGQIATLHQFGMTAGVGANVAAVERLDKVLMGRNGVLFDAGVDDSVRELEKLVESGTHATLTLTAGQADFYPLWPDPAAYTEAEYTEFIEWYNATTPGDPNVRPRAWTPIFLFPLPDDPLVTDPGLEDTYAMGAVHPLAAVDPTAAMDVPVQLNFLFRSPRLIPPGYPTPPGGAVDYYAALRARWSLLQRTVMYVSMNPQDFQPTQEDGSYLDPNEETLLTMPDNMPPAEALFVWDGDDGLENGAYDIYVVTMDDLSRLDDVYERLAGIDDVDDERVGDLFATAAEHDDRFDPKTLIGQAVRPEEMGITVEFFTDRDGNRRCWSGADAPAPALMNRGITGDPLAPQESFGLQVAPEPSTEGLVYYGQVTVENNYLALLLRNWAQGGRLNRFSRVILTSSRRTPGKVNVNTAATAILDYDGGTKPLNPLVGAPGALMRARTVEDEPGDPPRLVLSFPGELDGISPSEAFYVDAQGVAAGIESSAPAHYDGRYYRNAAELLTRGLGALAADPTEPLVDPTFILRTGRLSHLWPEDWLTELPEETDAMAPIVYDEKIQRFTRMSNLVTTHSDVFEVIVLGQSGYVTNDAVLDVEDAAGTPVRVVDWRNRFVVTGEKKIRTVYER